MRQNRAADAITAAEQALKIAPDNRDAHRVLGTVYGSLGTAEETRSSREAQRESLRKGIQHLELAVGPASARVQTDVNVRAMLPKMNKRYVTYGTAPDDLLALQLRDLHLGVGGHALCRGKGRKNRITPIDE